MPQIRFAESSRSWTNGQVQTRVHHRNMAVMTLEREFIALLTLGVKDQGRGFVKRRVDLARRLLRLHSLLGKVNCIGEF